MAIFKFGYYLGVIGEVCDDMSALKVQCFREFRGFYQVPGRCLGEGCYIRQLWEQAFYISIFKFVFQLFFKGFENS